MRPAGLEVAGAAPAPGWAAAAPARKLAFAAWAAGLALALFALAMTADATYDEDQYIAAGVMARSLRPYADFIYLQPPFYPLALSAIFSLTDGYYLLAGRLLTWALSVGTLALLFRTLLLLGAGRAMAVVLTTACALSPFLVGPMSNTRNDIMPVFFLMAGLLLYLRAGSAAAHSRRLLAAAGLCLGLAAATKISYAFAPLVVALHALAQGGRWRPALWPRLVPLLAGAGIAALPAAYYLLLAPEGFLYGLLEYHLTAPIAWYRDQGQSEVLGMSYRLVLLANLMLLGGNGTLVLLALLVLVAIRRIQRHAAGPREDGDRPTTHLLLALLAAAALLAYLPRPSWPMYFAPVPPLLACLVARLQGRARAAGAQPLAPVMLAVSLAPSLLLLGLLLKPLGRLPVAENWVGLAANHNARLVRQAILQAGGSGHVVTLFPSQVLDANPVRPEFASGPFFFRTAGLLEPERIGRLRGTGAAGLPGLLAADPPAAIFGGLYGRHWTTPLDAALSAYAEQQGYIRVEQELVAAGATRGWLYVRPGAGLAPAGD